MQRIVFRATFLAGCCVCLAQAQPLPGRPVRDQPCSLLPRAASKVESPSQADLLRAYDAQVHLFHSLHLVGTVRSSFSGPSSKNEKHKELAVIIDLLQPDMIRIEGIVPYTGNRVVELTGDGKDFGLLVPGDENKEYFYGPVDAPQRSQNAWENLRPGQFLPVLRWEEGRVQLLAQQAGTDPATASLLIDVPARGTAMPHKDRVQFDLENGTVNKLTIYDAADSPVFESYYSEWKTTRDPFGGMLEACYPRHILMVNNSHGYQVEIHLDDVTMNMEMPRSFFRPTPPRGIQIKRLDGANR